MLGSAVARIGSIRNNSTLCNSMRSSAKRSCFLCHYLHLAMGSSQLIADNQQVFRVATPIHSPIPRHFGVCCHLLLRNSRLPSAESPVRWFGKLIYRLEIILQSDSRTAYLVWVACFAFTFQTGLAHLPALEFGKVRLFSKFCTDEYLQPAFTVRFSVYTQMNSIATLVVLLQTGRWKTKDRKYDSFSYLYLKALFFRGLKDTRHTI